MTPTKICAGRVFPSQIPVDKWHVFIGDPTYADRARMLKCRTWVAAGVSRRAREVRTLRTHGISASTPRQRRFCLGKNLWEPE